MLYPLSYGRRNPLIAMFESAISTVSDNVKLVGVGGFEPTTSSSQSWRATRLRYTPIRLSFAL
jgi:hypothetical protein